MPNHISNKIKIIGSEKEIKEVLEFIKIDDEGVGTIDFNKITPMPKWVYGSNPEIIGISRSDEEKWGRENTSLEWMRRNWGTKWNAYGQPDSRNEDTFYFQTAWNGVPDLIQKIAWIFPNVIIEYSFADEDLGSSNCGFYRYKENEILEEIQYTSRSKEAYELAFDLVERGEVPEWYKFNESAGTYECVED